MENPLDLFQTAGDGACGIDEDQRIILWNHAAESLLGFEASEVLGVPCYEVFASVDDAGAPVCRRRCPIFQRARRADVVPSHTVCARRKNGERIWLSVTTIPLTGAWRHTAVLVHLFRDVTRSRRLQESMDRLRQEIGGEPGGGPTPPRPSPEGPRLTAREHDVLRLLGAGHSTAEMARTLHISPATVRNHVHALLGKLGARSRLEAVAIAVRRGLF